MAENANPESGRSGSGKKSGIIDRFLNLIEVVGNKLPDPAVLFLLLMFLVWILSWPLSQLEFDALNPVTEQPIQVVNQVSGTGIATLLTSMVKTFVNFAPLGVVLVALLGIGVADQTGLIGALIKSVLGVVPKSLLTPTLILVGFGPPFAAVAG